MSADSWVDKLCNICCDIDSCGERQYVIPNTKEEENDLRKSLQELSDGYMFWAKMYDSSGKPQVVSCSKVGNKLFACFPNGIVSELVIDTCNFTTMLQLFAKPQKIKINLLEPLNMNTNIEVLQNWKNPFFLHSLELVLLSSTKKFGKIIIYTKDDTIVIKTKGIGTERQKHKIAWNFQHCCISLYIDGATGIMRICADTGVFKEFYFDLTTILPADTTKHKQEQIESGDSTLVDNIVTAFKEATGTAQDQVLTEITSLVSRHESDSRRRSIGIRALKRIYKSSYTDVINRLWKTCKESSELQPYNIIDIAALDMKQELGHGTFGSVKKAIWHSPKGDKSVAVKVIQQNAQAFDLSDLRGEFVALSLIDHPNIIGMYGGGFVQHDLRIHNSTYWFIVMDLMDGNLSQLIRSMRFRSMEFVEKIKIAQQICAGLIHLHQHKIIHRDIKPENILYKRERNEYSIKIGDLGISKPENDTILRTVIGTHDYMAPELRQADRRMEFGQEVDIYSFGVLLWELFTGKTAAEFHANLKQASLFKRSSLYVRFPPGFPVWLGKLISKCTSNQPHKRFSARKIHEKFNHYLNPILSPAIRSRSKGESQNMRQSLPSTDSGKPSAIWFWNDEVGTCRKFSDEGCTIIEEYFQQGKDKRGSIEIQEKSLQGKFSLNINDFQLKSLDSDMKYTLDRKRVSKGGNATRTLRIERENDKSGNLLFTVTGLPEDDCSDVIFSVTYCFRNENKQLKKHVSRRAPYYLTIPPCRGEWIAVHISLDSYPYQVIEFSLEGSSQARHHDIELASVESITPFIYNTFTECSNSEFEKLEKAVYKLSLIRLNEIIDNIIQLSSKQLVSERDNLRYDIGKGLAGCAYFLWKVSTSDIYPEKTMDCLFAAKKIISVCVEEMKNCLSSVGFLFGSSGVFALASAIYHAIGDRVASSECIIRLFNIAKEFIVPSMFKRELENGISGFMASVLFVIKYIPHDYYDSDYARDILHVSFYAICGDIDGVISSAGYCAAKGLAGILFVLLKVPELVLGEYRQKIVCSLHFLMQQCADGILLDDRGPSVTFRWCEGNSGVISTLLDASEVFGDDEYQKLAVKAADGIWEFGIMRCGPSLYSGTLGNVYSLLQVYATTGNSKYLAQAYQLTMCNADPRISVIGLSNNSKYDFSSDTIDAGNFEALSLLDGSLGEACLFLDIQQPFHASFPGFHNDISSTTFL